METVILSKGAGVRIVSSMGRERAGIVLQTGGAAPGVAVEPWAYVAWGGDFHTASTVPLRWVEPTGETVDVYSIRVKPGTDYNTYTTLDLARAGAVSLAKLRGVPVAVVRYSADRTPGAYAEPVETIEPGE